MVSPLHVDTIVHLTSLLAVSTSTTLKQECAVSKLKYMQLRCRKVQRTCCGISLRKGSIATAATTVTVTTTVEIQPSSDSQDSFLKDGMNMSGKVAMTPTITENVKGLSPPTSAAQALVTLNMRACRIYLSSDANYFPPQPAAWMDVFL